ncbi:MAG TPA: efflux RND transporter permease subunit, partial [Salinivirgaceae bacterium]|nr:efflux RND transporter permease subunit [Salinivirgaceae bacterium]
NLYDRLGVRLELVQEIKQQYGITEVVSVGQLVNLVRNDSIRKFEFQKIFPQRVTSQSELDSLYQVLRGLPFYVGLVYNDTAHVYPIAVTMDKNLLNISERISIINNVHRIAQKYSDELNIKFYYSGLPYIRTEISKKIKAELGMFVFLAFLVTGLILYLFFHSLKAVFFSLFIVGIGVLWSVGFMGLFNFEITVLTGMIPPVLIVIGVPNTIFMLNKYHFEFKRHGNKIRALQRVITKTGNAIFLSNLTTAIGFATFILTSSKILVEFGIIASLSIFSVFVLTITLIPIIFSFIAPPKHRHVKHLDKRWTDWGIKKIENISTHHRNKVYLITIGLVLIAFYGITRIHTTGYMVDDIPHDDPIYTDLKFFEKYFNGIMPVEILIDTREKQGAFKLENLRKVDYLADSLRKYPQLSKPYSLAEASKFLRQGYYDGDPKRYRIPVERERLAIGQYLKFDSLTKHKNILNAYVDTAFQVTRVSMQMHDVGTTEMSSLIYRLQDEVESVFPKEKYTTMITGTSIVYAKGTEYLVKNLFISLAIAILVITLVMSYMFISWRMVLISLIPNLVPQILTAGLMGFLGIPIKVSTILIFSIAYGISVDNTIHFLTKYRQELRIFKGSISHSVVAAIREKGVSMMYTGIVLFSGFAMFSASEFGGTKALGILVSLTLLFAMFANLVILPSLLLSFKDSITTKSFQNTQESFDTEDED